MHCMLAILSLFCLYLLEYHRTISCSIFLCMWTFSWFLYFCYYEAKVILLQVSFCMCTQMFLQRRHLIMKFSRQKVCCLSIFSGRASPSKHRFYRVPEIYIVSLGTFTFQDQYLLNLLSTRAQVHSLANNVSFLLLIRYLSKKNPVIYLDKNFMSIPFSFSLLGANLKMSINSFVLLVNCILSSFCFPHLHKWSTVLVQCRLCVCTSSPYSTS